MATKLVFASGNPTLSTGSASTATSSGHCCNSSAAILQSIVLNQTLENHQDNNESTNSNDCQSHADEQTQYQPVDNLAADHLIEKQVCDSHACDITFTLEDLTDFDKPNNVNGNLQENDIYIDGNTTRNSSISLDKSDGYLELNDVYANANGHCTSALDDCIRSNHANNANTSLNIEDAEIFNNSNATTATEGVQNMQPYAYLNHADDDLMAYFDATEQEFDPLSVDHSAINNAKIISEIEGSNYPTGKGESKETPGTNIGTDVQASEGWNKSFRKHIVGMLGSMSAPPAMAAADSCKGKGIQISGGSSSSSIRVSAGKIQIRGISVMEHPEKWTLSKDGERSFIYTYANGAVDQRYRESTWEKEIWSCIYC